MIEEIFAGGLLAPAILLLSGLFAGFLAGLLGVGGGIIYVPVLFYTLPLLSPELFVPGENLMHVALGTSLAVILPAGSSALRAHWRRGSVRLDFIAQLIPGVLIGAACGVILAGFLESRTLRTLFACILLCLSVLMAWPVRGGRRATPGPQDSASTAPGKALSWAGGLLIGAISTLAGIGGATLSVPFMRLFGLTMQQAIGTATALGLLIALPGVVGFILIGVLNAEHETTMWTIGYVCWPTWILLSCTAVISAPAGAALAHRLQTGVLKLSFSVLMAFVAFSLFRV